MLVHCWANEVASASAGRRSYIHAMHKAVTALFMSPQLQLFAFHDSRSPTRRWPNINPALGQWLVLAGYDVLCEAESSNYSLDKSTLTGVYLAAGIVHCYASQIAVSAYTRQVNSYFCLPLHWYGTLSSKSKSNTSICLLVKWADTAFHPARRLYLQSIPSSPIMCM